MNERTYLKVVAHLSSPLAGDAPMLDAILYNEMAQRERVAVRLNRAAACPAFESVHLPMLLGRIDGIAVPHCTSPIFIEQGRQREHFTKRLSVENAPLISAGSRRVVAMGNATYKSYRLPVDVRRVDCIVWFCIAKRRPVKQLLRSVHSIGENRSQGYGRVGRWELGHVDYAPTWYANCDGGRVLMRPLPLCDETADLVGSRDDFGAVQPPYWHPARFTERVVPC